MTTASSNRPPIIYNHRVAMTDPDILGFGSFELHPASGELRRSGRRVHLPPQAFELLLLLARRSGEVVTRDDIRQTLWPSDTFVDFDASVNGCISQIRSVLLDKASSPRFVETLPRRGYRFLAPVTTVTRHEEHPPAPPANVAPVAVPSRTPVVALVGIVAMLSATVGLALMAARTAGSAETPAERLAAFSLKAVQKYERGRSGLHDASPSELLDRVKHFETAIGLEPRFAEAYAGLAEAKLLLATYRAEQPQLAYAAAKAAAARAIGLNPRLGEAHAAYGAAVLFFDWNWPEAAAHLREAERLSPQAPSVQHWYGRYLTAAGRYRDAQLRARRVAALAPGSPSALTYRGVAAFYAADFAEARDSCQRALAVMPEFVPAKTCLASLDDPLTAAPAMPDAALAPALAALRSGNRAESVRVLQTLANRHHDSLVFVTVQPGFRDGLKDDDFRHIAVRLGHPAFLHAR